MMLGLYTLPQWVLLFFSYGFLGWVWESGYVSVRQKHWVNRGFLHGPVIPIYGFGAVAILALCAPVAGSLPMLFFSGMFWATALEYATGWAMERMFHVRYWDYSTERWNLNGYICLMASLCWGVFSVLLLRVIQPPVAGAVTALSGPAAAMLAMALTLAFAADVIASTREALDLRRLLEQLSASREQIARLQRRLEIAGVFLQQDAREALDGLRKEGERAAGVVSLRLEAARERRRRMLWQMSRQLEQLRREGKLHPGFAGPDQKAIQRELSAMHRRTDEMYRRAARVLQRNPGSTTSRHPEALEELRTLTGSEP